MLPVILYTKAMNDVISIILIKFLLLYVDFPGYPKQKKYLGGMSITVNCVEQLSREQPASFREFYVLKP